MKTKVISLLIILSCFFTACKKEGTPKEKVFDPDAKLSVAIPYNSQKNTIKSFSDSVSEAQARFLLDHGYEMRFTSFLTESGIVGEPRPAVMSLAFVGRPDIYYNLRDTVNIKYTFWGGKVIIFVGNAETPVLSTIPTAENLVLVTMMDSAGNLIDLPNITWEQKENPRYDTIAYMPNEMMRNGKKQLNAALAREDYEECYRIFNDLYKFIPITGAEYMELVRQGKN